MKWIGAEKSQAVLPRSYAQFDLQSVEGLDTLGQAPAPKLRILEKARARSTCGPDDTPRTAFLVIHGIGDQDPYETLDPFARGFHALYGKRDLSPTLAHHLAERIDAQGDTWTESFVALESTGPRFDVHEYFWAQLTEEKMEPKEIWAWFSTAVTNAKALRKENPELASLEPFIGDMAKRAFFVGRAVKRFFPLIWLLRNLASAWPGARLFKGLTEFGAKKQLKAYLGDLAVYNSMDAKSEYFAIRNKIISQGQALLHSLLADPRYDRVIVVGHSLGSAIAYDILNRTSVQTSIPNRTVQGIQKLERGGLVTFGCPLDEIRYFFLAKARRDEWVRRGINDNLHAFRSVAIPRKRPKPGEAPEPTLKSQIQDPIPKLPWFNYHSPQDPISGSLELFTPNDNVSLDYPSLSWFKGHTAYWGDQRFYEDLDRRFGLTPGGGPSKAAAIAAEPPSRKRTR